jgi:hypothetical protein
MQLGNEHFKKISLNQIAHQPQVLARQIEPGLYEGWFKEVRCLCDNSFNIVHAYLVNQEESWLVLRKRDIGDRFSNDDDFQQWASAHDEPELFSEFPQLYAKSKLQP